MSFRGTASFANIIADINLVMVPTNLCLLCTAHSGFLDSWNSVKPQIQAVLASARKSFPSYKIVATGHSLGGAVATLAAADLRKNSGYDVSLVRAAFFLHVFPVDMPTVYLRLAHGRQLPTRDFRH